MKDKKACIFYFLMTLIFLDFGNQLRKISFNSYFDDYSNPVFSIVHLNNTGSAFSLFQGHTQMLAFFGIVAIILIAFYVFKNVAFEDKFAILSLTLFSAGALGNVIERIKYGFVIDYIKLSFIEFPVFNAFDIMICIGIFLYLFFVLFDFKNLKKIQRTKNE